MAGEGVMDGLSACECPVCFNLLGSDRPPMSMPCGHTLCHVCVDELTEPARKGRGAPTFRCPLCREWVNRESVMLNVTLRDLIDELCQLRAAPPTPALGTVLNVNYAEVEVRESLDRGAFGEVYRGRWRGDEVAVKVFACGQLTPEAMQAFQREVYVMNCLRHPNVVLLMGACQTPPRLAILMEFVAGGSLHKLLHVNKVSLPPAAIQTLSVCICRGLQYLHSINILHRDLKSKNVLLTAAPPHGQAKLCDFGLARMRLESATMTGNVGTVHWTSPEVLNNVRYQFPADVYSFGMVLYEMVCGRVPFHNMLPIAVMMAVVLNRQQPDIPSDAHPELAELIRSCIRWEPSERPSLAQIITTLTNLFPPSLIPPSHDSPKRRELVHSDSLGVVFLSVGDSTDVGQQQPELQQLVKQVFSPSNEQEPPLAAGYQQESFLAGGNPGDYEVALQLHEEERRHQEELDSRMAEQIQLREHTFLAPTSLKLSGQPPRPLLNSIESGEVPQLKPVSKSVGKRLNKQKVVMEERDSAPSKSGGLAQRPQQLSTKSKAFVREVPSSKKVSNPHPRKVAAISKNAKSRVTAKPEAPDHGNTSKSHQSLPNPPPPKVAAIPAKKKGAPLKKKVAKPVNPPPSPPPPPPPPPPRSPSLRIVSNNSSTRNTPRRSAHTFSKFLQPVETVVKRAFRVGHVVGGYNAESSQFTFQNQVASFSHRRLHHVDLVEPPPAFPVGRVVKRKQQGHRVKRMSSLLDTSIPTTSPQDQPPQGQPPQRRIHPSIQAAIQTYQKGSLQHVEPVVKATLPSSEVIEQERALEARAHQPALHPVIRADIEAFPSQLLNPVETVVKLSLPTREVIEQEKALEARAHQPALHPVIRADIEAFPSQLLNPVETVVKLSLPTREDIELAKALEVDRQSSVEGLRAVRAEIETFPRSTLRHVEPVVKIVLPSFADILRERSMLEDGEREESERVEGSTRVLRTNM